MELPELLMIEHVSFRLQFQKLRNDKEIDHFLTLHDFVLNCHAKVEDEALFPRMWTIKGEGEELQKTARSLAADHKLIEKFGENMRHWLDEGNQELFKKRVETYISTVENHNSSEEKLIFPSWALVEEPERWEAMREAKSIIESYGLDKYMLVTGISREFFNMM